MTIRTLFFAAYRDLVGCEEIDVVLPHPARVRDLLDALRARGGGWSRLPPEPAVAVNMEYATAERDLREGDEVALIPPVSGGVL
jgi:molybdopterin converting factor subunit 1